MIESCCLDSDQNFIWAWFRLGNLLDLKTVALQRQYLEKADPHESYCNLRVVDLARAASFPCVESQGTGHDASSNFKRSMIYFTNGCRCSGLRSASEWLTFGVSSSDDNQPAICVTPQIAFPTLSHRGSPYFPQMPKMPENAHGKLFLNHTPLVIDLGLSLMSKLSSSLLSQFLTSVE